MSNEISQNSLQVDDLYSEGMNADPIPLEPKTPSKSIDMLNDLEMTDDINLNVYENLDESQFLSAITRLIESPEPLIPTNQFLFVNIENAEDDKEPSFEVFSLTKESELITMESQIPYLRPDSPSIVVASNPIENETLDSKDDGPPVIEEPEEIIVEKKIDREEYIAKIKQSLIKKDRLNNKNQNLQGKLTEYFRKKRVTIYM